ncbi:unnamed protein product [Cyprideis torosa]|uniref:Uncharacterized protein n=1 Tax=Cyprideis torosa TaxID=163714 RepID=A0A7R8ZXD5_9CRUS|nr:unnamed protein product [Cyprideis torosa]CAG0906943.1 unnamed protein product [Cyprideis torosa]
MLGGSIIPRLRMLSDDCTERRLVHLRCRRKSLPSRLELLLSHCQMLLAEHYENTLARGGGHLCFIRSSSGQHPR